MGSPGPSRDRSEVMENQVEKLVDTISSSRLAARIFANRHLTLENVLDKVSNLASSCTTKDSELYQNLSAIISNCSEELKNTKDALDELEAKRLDRIGGPDNISLAEKIRKAREKLEQKKIREAMPSSADNYKSITLNVFKCLPIKDLLNCTLVNKDWSGTARIALSSKRTMVRFDPQIICQNIEVFNSLLEDLSRPPFYNGLSLPFDYGVCQCPFKNFDVQFSPKIQVIHLKIDRWLVQRPCVIFKILRDILTSEMAVRNLKTVTIGEILVSNLGLIDGINQTLSHFQDTLPPLVDQPVFPNLTEISVLGNPDLLCMQLILDFIRAAPNLQTFNGVCSSLSILPALLANRRAHILRKLYCLFRTLEELTILSAFVRENPILDSLVVRTYAQNPQPILWPQVRGSLTELYKQSSTKSQQNHLKTLEISPYYFLMFAIPTMPSLDALRILKVDFDRRWMKYSTKIDFLAKFPNLELVSLEKGTATFRDIVDPLPSFEGWTEVEELPNIMDTNCKSSKLTKLVWKAERDFLSSFELYHDDCAGINYFALITLFPHIVHLQLTYFSSLTSLDRLFENLWTWENLESLTLLGLTNSNVFFNMDEILTGVPEDVGKIFRKAKLYDDFEEYIIPVYSIRNLSKLKLFRMEFLHHETKCKKIAKYPNDFPFLKTFFTEVTAKCGFEAMADLKVEICREKCHDPICYLNLDSLVGYVSFIPFEPGNALSKWNLELD